LKNWQIVEDKLFKTVRSDKRKKNISVVFAFQRGFCFTLRYLFRVMKREAWFYRLRLYLQKCKLEEKKKRRKRKPSERLRNSRKDLVPEKILSYERLSNTNTWSVDDTYTKTLLR
jgi:hypothetical protein